MVDRGHCHGRTGRTAPAGQGPRFGEEAGMGVPAGAQTLS